MLRSCQLEIVLAHVLVFRLDPGLVVDRSEVGEALVLEPWLEVVWSLAQTNGKTTDQLERQGVEDTVLMLEFVLDPLEIFKF